MTWRVQLSAPRRKNARAAVVAIVVMRRALPICILILATLSAFAGIAKNVVINAAVTRVQLTLASGASSELVLRNIHFDVHPGTQFNVFLECVDNSAKRVRVGTLSFYAASRNVTTSRTFDVTDELKQLGPKGKTVNVVFEATSGRGKVTFSSQSKLTIAELALRAKR